MQISVADAKAQFSEVLRRAAAGEVIEVTRYGKTIAKVVAPKADAPPAETREEIRARRESAFGMLKGKVRYEDGWDQMTEEELADWENSPLFPGDQSGA